MKLFASTLKSNYNDLTIKKLQKVRKQIQSKSNDRQNAENNQIKQSRVIDPQKLKKFIKQVRNINTTNLRAKFSSNDQSDLFNFLKKPEVKKKDITDLTSKVLSMGDREDFQNFLNNNWLNFVLKQKTLKNDENFELLQQEQLKNISEQKQILDECTDKKQILNNYLKAIKNQPDDFEEFGESKEQDLGLSQKSSRQLFKKYIEEKRSVNEKKQIQNIRLISSFNEIIEQINQNQLDARLIDIDFDYERKIKRRRIIQSLKDLAKKAIKYQTSVYNVFKLILNILQLIKYNFQNKSPFMQNGSFAIIEHSKKGNFQKILHILNQNPKLINEFDEVIQQMTALHWSVKKQHLEISQLLLKHGAFVNAKNIFDQTPLQFAIENDDIKLVEVDFLQNINYQILLANDASPWVSRKTCQSQRIRQIIIFSQYLSIFNKLKKQLNLKYAIQQLQSMSMDQIKLINRQFSRISI